MKNRIWYYLKSGWKLGIILLLSNLILFIPKYIFNIDLLNLTNITDPEVLGKTFITAMILLIVLIPITLTLNGYLVNKFKKWIFK